VFLPLFALLNFICKSSATTYLSSSETLRDKFYPRNSLTGNFLITSGVSTYREHLARRVKSATAFHLFRSLFCPGSRIPEGV
ncbi:MAG: hypothetical protein ACYC9O_01940, partial [Candidatus Latescibacterota bacterium]